MLLNMMLDTKFEKAKVNVFVPFCLLLLSKQKGSLGTFKCVKKNFSL